MSVFSLFKKQVEEASEKKRIVFPESDDLRVLTAVSNLNKDGIIEPILIGNKDEVQKLAADHNLDIDGVKIYDQNNYDDLDEMADAFVKARRKDTSIAEAKAKLAQGNYFGTMLVQMGKADGMVSGAAHSTANTVLPALQLIHAAKGMHRVSGAFVMEKGNERYIFADCAININPDEETLAEIGYQSAQTAKMAEIDPKVAFLSFSTNGSATGPMVDKVHDAAAMFQKNHPEIPADGELQFDAAFVPAVGKKKAPDSKVAGHANVFIFPELQSGNIAYKMVQRLGGFTAVGPILQGLAAPVNDLSRGCSEQDIYDLAIVTAAQSLAKDNK
ncbi:phosphate acetyltransferase [Lactobacillus ultunensis]|uniref:Phosphate acetyltransferase n=1 Tax=Lactobacillus ultunensis DSM 16047 TaxID=525365 RepID=C2EM41_9LACO|nr:phosphate acetyltransferase [Lactobacillus ultunensis]EEJ72404.1 phosphate acetyltransferase [Lactobacillus ultunensis DSM 16047]KRL82585.1 phosphate acetyltransferase [Lactobacillus ultunensis DSM 16047]QQP27987.1 phosphate acetyltransferase [Lactobacillus ultunensis]